MDVGTPWGQPGGSAAGECHPEDYRTGKTIKVLQVKYLNNILEQDHRFIKRITAPMMGFNAFHPAIAGIEAAHMIRKGQIPANDRTAFRQFAGLTA